jgi:hypothetical protein
MSQTSFVALAKQHPELQGAISELGAWLDSHASISLVDPRSLAASLHEVTSIDLARSLLVLADAGILVQTYKVVTPSGVYADGEFDDPSVVPEKLPDRFAHYFDTAEADIVPVFRRRA